jgi:hypothetical protein
VSTRPSIKLWSTKAPKLCVIKPLRISNNRHIVLIGRAKRVIPTRKIKSGLLRPGRSSKTYESEKSQLSDHIRSISRLICWAYKFTKCFLAHSQTIGTRILHTLHPSKKIASTKQGHLRGYISIPGVDSSVSTERALFSASRVMNPSPSYIKTTVASSTSAMHSMMVTLP